MRHKGSVFAEEENLLLPLTRALKYKIVYSDYEDDCSQVIYMTSML